MADDKLDKIASHLDDIHKMCTDNAARMDALDAEHKKDREEHAASRAKADAEKEKDEKEKKDAAIKADAAAAAGPRANASMDDRNKFAASQMRLDAACQAWGHQCRAPLAGESLRDYRVSVLNGLKSHSKRYSQSDLSLVGDEAVFDTIEGAIVNDAVEASTSNIKPGAPLRSITKRNPDTGHAVTTFHGDPLVTWAQFAGGATRFGRIVRPMGVISGGR